MKVIFLFLDGLGVGPETAENPFLRLRLPFFEARLGGPFSRRTLPFWRRDEAFFLADAGLGVDGLPQSATGQTTIFTGQNAARRMGRHVSGFPLARLRRLLEAGNLFSWLVQQGKRCAFANAFTPEFFQLRTTRRGWVSCSTRAAWAAGLPLRTLDDLLAGQAVFHDLTRFWYRQRRPETPVPLITPQEAAEHLLAISRQHDFVFHEFFLTDVAGHTQDFGLLQAVLQRYDAFLQALDAARPPDVTLVLASDHGNCEDLSVKTHTGNPVPVWIIGPGAALLERPVCDLTDVTPSILTLFGLPPAEKPAAESRKEVSD
jgi:hypothetical protein